MKTTWMAVTLALAAAALPAQDSTTLAEARKGFQTKLTKRDKDDSKLDAPPKELFTIAKYKGQAGALQAYVGTAPKPGKHPAIVWITGGFPPGGASASAWDEPDRNNEQSAQAYRHAGIVMMYPTVRGSCGNAGVSECFLGEVDDILSALDYLKSVPHVDPARIYLGGHSTGATLALLVAAMTDRVKGVFALGPIDDPANYGAKNCPYDVSNAAEARVRAPIHWLGGIKAPTFVIEGQGGNIEALKAMQDSCKNPAVKFFSVSGSDHFESLAAVNGLIAKEIAAGAVNLTATKVQTAYDDEQTASREAADLRTLAYERRAGHPLSAVKTIRFRILCGTEAPLKAVAEATKTPGLESEAIEPRKNGKGEPYFVLVVKKTQKLGDLDALLTTSAKIDGLCKKFETIYNGWSVE